MIALAEYLRANAWTGRPAVTDLLFVCGRATGMVRVSLLDEVRWAMKFMKRGRG